MEFFSMFLQVYTTTNPLHSSITITEKNITVLHKQLQVIKYKKGMFFTFQS